MKNTHNTLFFREPNLENAYWAGFIAADGNLCLKEQKYKMLQIVLHNKDVEILEQFKEQTKSTNNIHFLKTKEHARLGIRATEWFDDLGKYWNITPNKTHTLQPPNLTNLEHQLAYIIGLIDGDGSICICNFNQKHKGKTYTYPRIKFMACGTLPLMQWCSTILNKIELEKYNPLRVETATQSNLKYIRCDKLRAKLLLQRLLEVNVPWRLPRKWDIVRNY